jgi:hypothetical protein
VSTEQNEQSSWRKMTETDTTDFRKIIFIGTWYKSVLEGPFIRLSMIRSETRINRKRQTNADMKKKKQNMHGMYRHQAKRKERMRTEARNRSSVRTCEGMSATCL